MAAAAAPLDEGHWSLLPEEVLQLCFQYLSARELLLAASVCTFWRRLALDPIIWRAKYLQLFGPNRRLSHRPNGPAVDEPEHWCNQYFNRIALETKLERRFKQLTDIGERTAGATVAQTRIDYVATDIDAQFVSVTVREPFYMFRDRFMKEGSSVFEDFNITARDLTTKIDAGLVGALGFGLNRLTTKSELEDLERIFNVYAIGRDDLIASLGDSFAVSHTELADIIHIVDPAQARTEPSPARAGSNRQQLSESPVRRGGGPLAANVSPGSASPGSSTRIPPLESGRVFWFIGTLTRPKNTADHYMSFIAVDRHTIVTVTSSKLWT